MKIFFTFVVPIMKCFMLDFKEIELTDKPWADELLRYADLRNTESSFAALFIWKTIYNTRICRFGDFLLVRSEHPVTGEGACLFPMGRGDAKAAVDALREDAHRRGGTLVLHSVLAGQKAMLEAWYPGVFRYEQTRNSFDYVYRAADLIALKGRKYQPKRNHIARFRELPGWRYEPVGPENLHECTRMNDEWCRLYGCGQDLSLSQEMCSVRSALRNFGALGLRGGLLRVGDRVVAYTLGEQINSDTVLVHVEKAFADVRGAYPAISQEFLIHQMRAPYVPGSEPGPEETGFVYVNREDDAGDEGLRTAKLQYHPAFLIEKYLVQE